MKDQPKSVRYRLEPVNISKNDLYTSVVERDAYFEENGWTFVTTLNDLYNVYMADKNESMEIHTDPFVQSFAYERLVKNFIRSSVGAVLWIFILATTIIYPLDEFRGFVIADGTLLDFAFLLVVIMFFLYTLWKQIYSTLNISQLKKSLRQGISLNHYKSYKTKKILKYVGLVIHCTTVIFFFVYIFYLFERVSTNL